MNYCGVCVVGIMSKDIGMGVRKGTVVSFIPTLFGCFLEIPSLYVFHFFKMFFVTLRITTNTEPCIAMLLKQL